MERKWRGFAILGFAALLVSACGSNNNNGQTGVSVQPCTLGNGVCGTWLLSTSDVNESGLQVRKAFKMRIDGNALTSIVDCTVPSLNVVKSVQAVAPAQVVDRQIVIQQNAVTRENYVANGVTLTCTAEFSTATFNYEISGNTLTLINPTNGQRGTVTRVQ